MQHPFLFQFLLILSQSFIIAIIVGHPFSNDEQLKVLYDVFGQFIGPRLASMDTLQTLLVHFRVSCVQSACGDAIGGTGVVLQPLGLFPSEAFEKCLRAQNFEQLLDKLKRDAREQLGGERGNPEAAQFMDKLLNNVDSFMDESGRSPRLPRTLQLFKLFALTVSLLVNGHARRCLQDPLRRCPHAYNARPEALTEARAFFAEQRSPWTFDNTLSSSYTTHYDELFNKINFSEQNAIEQCEMKIVNSDLPPHIKLAYSLLELSSTFQILEWIQSSDLCPEQIARMYCEKWKVNEMPIMSKFILRKLDILIQINGSETNKKTGQNCAQILAPNMKAKKRIFLAALCDLVSDLISKDIQNGEISLVDRWSNQWLRSGLEHLVMRLHLTVIYDGRDTIRELRTKKGAEMRTEEKPNGKCAKRDKPKGQKNHTLLGSDVEEQLAKTMERISRLEGALHNLARLLPSGASTAHFRLDAESLLGLLLHVRISTTIGLCGTAVFDEQSLMATLDQSEFLRNCLWHRDFGETVQELRSDAEKWMGQREDRRQAGQLLLELYTYLAELTRNVHMAGKPLIQFHNELYSVMRMLVETKDAWEKCPEGGFRWRTGAMRYPRCWRHEVYTLNRTQEMLKGSVQFFEAFDGTAEQRRQKRNELRSTVSSFILSTFINANGKDIEWKENFDEKIATTDMAEQLKFAHFMANLEAKALWHNVFLNVWEEDGLIVEQPFGMEVMAKAYQGMWKAQMPEEIVTIINALFERIMIADSEHEIVRSKQKPEDGIIFVNNPLIRDNLIFSSLYGMAINFVNELLPVEPEVTESWALRQLAENLQKAKRNISTRFDEPGWTEGHTEWARQTFDEFKVRKETKMPEYPMEYEKLKINDENKIGEYAEMELMKVVGRSLWEYENDQIFLLTIESEMTFNEATVITAAIAKFVQIQLDVKNSEMIDINELKEILMSIKYSQFYGWIVGQPLLRLLTFETNSFLMDVYKRINYMARTYLQMPDIVSNVLFTNKLGHLGKSLTRIILESAEMESEEEVEDEEEESQESPPEDIGQEVPEGISQEVPEGIGQKPSEGILEWLDMEHYRVMHKIFANIVQITEKILNEMDVSRSDTHVYLHLPEIEPERLNGEMVLNVTLTLDILTSFLEVLDVFFGSKCRNILENKQFWKKKNLMSKNEQKLVNCLDQLEWRVMGREQNGESTKSAGFDLINLMMNRIICKLEEAKVTKIMTRKEQEEQQFCRFEANVFEGERFGKLSMEEKYAILLELSRVGHEFADKLLLDYYAEPRAELFKAMRGRMVLDRQYYGELAQKFQMVMSALEVQRQIGIDINWAQNVNVKFHFDWMGYGMTMMTKSAQPALDIKGRAIKTRRKKKGKGGRTSDKKP